MSNLRIGILISGRGSNMAALVQACEASDLSAEVVCVISNKKDAKGLESARAKGVFAYAPDFSSKQELESKITEEFKKQKVDLICLAGFMQLLSAEFVAKWEGKIINIHPSLLPSFKGLDTYRRALQEGVKFSGCTVHFVTAEMDVGPIIIQAAVPVLPQDSESDLAARILAAEHKIYPKAVKMIANKQVEVLSGGVKIKGEDCESNTLFNPKL